MCGSDHHFTSEGGFFSKFPLVPGHEIVGTVAAVGSSVQEFSIGDRCVADPIVTCDTCFFCRRGQSQLCEKWEGLGVNLPGGCAEYVVVQSNKVFKIFNVSDEEATLIEPASCAIYGIDKLKSSVGAEVLVLGAGPSGLMLAQLLKLNGASRVVIAANRGIKTKVARDLDCGDEYVELDRLNPEPQWAELRTAHPYGFDIVVEATGSERVANDAIHHVRRGGTLMLYSLYSDNSLVHWPPSKIFGDEINIIGTVAQRYCFPRAVAYLDSGKIRAKGMVTDIFSINDYEKALDKMNSKEAVKIAVKP
ncbi:GroES-like protein [Tricholoma matsutake]|nr:GroES-like protein [Tricholoma matsutake 945]